MEYPLERAVAERLRELKAPGAGGLGDGGRGLRDGQAGGGALAPGGVLVLLIPEGSLEEAWGFLQGKAASATAFRLPEGEREAFQQVAVVARKRRWSWEWFEERLKVAAWEQGLARAKRIAEEARVEEEPVLREVRDALPPGLREGARHSPLWERVEGECAREGVGFRPLLPLRQAHLALLVAGGILDLQEVELEGEPYVLLGRLRKEVVEVTEETEEEVRRIEREVFRAGIVALNLRTGEVWEME